MKIVFRVDSSIRMGTGHLMRSITLAEAFQIRGVEVQFICRDHEGNFIHLLQQKALPIIVLPAPILSGTTNGENYAEWLGVTQNQDAAETIDALYGEKPDWLVADHYGIDIEWEKLVRPHVKQLMVIDDLANRFHDCDILLDQNYSFEGELRYKGLLPERCRLLVGPRFALLRPEYRMYRKSQHDRDGQVSKVMVFFGGSDPENMTGMALAALSHSDLKHLDVDLVVGVNSKYYKEIAQQADKRLKTKIYSHRQHLADLMAQADLAIGAAGSTTWERMCLGLPSVIISIAENQRPGSNALAAAKLIYHIGYVSDINVDQLRTQLHELLENPDQLKAISVRNKLEVDGFGAQRLLEIMFPSADRDLSLRPAQIGDIVLYYNWANNPEVRKSSINTYPIPWPTHKEWFAKKLTNKNSRLFVFEAKGLPIGQIRFDKVGNEALIDYSLDSFVRGRGLGSKLVALGVDIMQHMEKVTLHAEVKKDNHKSSNAFLRAGFIESQNFSGERFRHFYRNSPILSIVHKD